MLGGLVSHPSRAPPAPASRMTAGLPLPLQYRLSRLPSPTATRRCGCRYRVWSNAEGVCALAVACAEQANTRQRLAAHRKMGIIELISPIAAYQRNLRIS